MRALCLIIDSDPGEPWRATYDCHRRIWHQALDLCPWVDGVFIRSIPDLDHDHELEERLLRVRGEEDWGTVLHKTKRALGLLLGDHTHVIRTNVSSLYDFRVLQDIPGSPARYEGETVEGQYVTGSGILMSNDVARSLLDPCNLELPYWDDIAIGQILASRNVRAAHRPAFIYNFSRGVEQLEEAQGQIHYRFRHYEDSTRSQECAAKAAAFERIYRCD